MALKISFKRNYIVTLLYLSYVLNFSVLTIWPFGFDFSLLRNGLLILLFFMTLLKFNLKINLSIFLLIVICIVSLMLNRVDPVFNSGLRLAFFVITFTAIGLLTKTDETSEEFINFDHLFKINTLIVILSFVSYFTYIGSLGRGNFNGVFNHSNALAPIAALVCVEKTLQFFKEGKKAKPLFIALIAFLIVILTGARSSLAAMVLCLTFIGFYIYRVKFVFFGLGIFILGLITFFTLKNFNSYLIPEEHLTNRYRPRTIFEKGFDNTRFIIWGERIDEFKAKPIFGSGFAAVNTDIIPKESGSYDIKTGSIQPGSGYLGVLSMLGITGFLVFTNIVIISISKLYKKRHVFNSKNYLIIVSILMFVLVHSIFEGYIISSGSILFLIFWLAVSYIFNKNEA